MNYYFAFSVLLTIVYNCDGRSYNTPILSGFFSGAQKVNSDVQAALQGLTQGIELNFQGSPNNNRGTYQYGQQQPRPSNGNNEPTPPTETIIVIVEESEPQQNNYGQRPQLNNWHGPPQNTNYNKPNYLNKPYNYGYNSNNYGQSYHQHRPHHHHHHTPEYHNHPNGHYNNNYGNYNQNDNVANHNGDTQPSEKPYQYDPPKEIATEAPKAPIQIATEAPKAKPYYGNDNDKKPTTTTKQDEDKPFFVPLTADQYSYGGDKIEINAPKRQTSVNNKSANDDAVDETFPIDVRLKE